MHREKDPFHKTDIAIRNAMEKYGIASPRVMFDREVLKAEGKQLLFLMSIPARIFPSLAILFVTHPIETFKFTMQIDNRLEETRMFKALTRINLVSNLTP